MFFFGGGGGRRVKLYMHQPYSTRGKVKRTPSIDFNVLDVPRGTNSKLQGRKKRLKWLLETYCWTGKRKKATKIFSVFPVPTDAVNFPFESIGL